MAPLARNRIHGSHRFDPIALGSFQSFLRRSHPFSHSTAAVALYFFSSFYHRTASHFSVSVTRRVIVRQRPLRQTLSEGILLAGGPCN